MGYTSGINAHLRVFAVLSSYTVRNNQYAYHIVCLPSKERTPLCITSSAQHGLLCRGRLCLFDLHQSKQAAD